MSVEDEVKLPAAIHPGWTCDNCSQLPIRGVRYQCTICKDFDLCESCQKWVEDEKSVVAGVGGSQHTYAHPMKKHRTSLNQHVLPTVYSGCSGYPLEMFVHEKASIRTLNESCCPICLCVAKKAVVTSCGHLFCEDCINAALLYRVQCPQCSASTVTPESIRNPSLSSATKRSMISALPVMCEHRDLGCKWKGPLGRYEDHKTSGCSFKSCRFRKYGCGGRGDPDSLEKHYAEESSQHFLLMEKMLEKRSQAMEMLGMNHVRMLQFVQYLQNEHEQLGQSLGLMNDVANNLHTRQQQADSQIAVINRVQKGVVYTLLGVSAIQVAVGLARWWWKGSSKDSSSSTD